MIGVEAQLYVGLADGFDARQAFVDAVVEIVGKARPATGLEDQGQAFAAGQRGRVGNVLQEYVAALGPVHARGDVSGHGMNHGAADLDGVLHGAFHAAPEVGLAPRQGSDAAFTRRPIARGEHLDQGQAVLTQQVRDLAGGVFVRERHLHAFEPGARGRTIPLQHRQFGKHPAQVGIETQH
ncbi:hypothetical protein D9M70_525590 [compost metagenome]